MGRTNTTKTTKAKPPVNALEHDVVEDEEDDEGEAVSLQWDIATKGNVAKNRMGAGWLGRKFLMTCGSAYEDFYYTVTPETDAGRPLAFASAPHLVATPLDDYSASQVADMMSIVKANQADVNAASYLTENAPDQDWQNVVFATADNPDDWVGIVSFSCVTYLRPEAVICAEIHLTFVHPNYRKRRLGCAISGMCGYLLSEALMLGFLGDKRILESRSVRLEASGEPAIAHGEFMIRSFCGGVAFLISQPEMWGVWMDCDEQDSDEIAFIYEGPNVDW